MRNFYQPLQLLALAINRTKCYNARSGLRALMREILSKEVEDEMG